jgi:hypothetical protein
MLNIFKAILLAAIMSFVIAELGERSKATSEGFAEQKIETPQSNDSKTIISQRVKTLPE